MIEEDNAPGKQMASGNLSPALAIRLVACKQMALCLIFVCDWSKPKSKQRQNTSDSIRRTTTTTIIHKFNSFKSKSWIARNLMNYARVRTHLRHSDNTSRGTSKRFLNYLSVGKISRLKITESNRVPNAGHDEVRPGRPLVSLIKRLDRVVHA